uniref:AT-HSFB3 (Arabidopsis thaliana heat shock transcription factor B3) n=1 Tax=Solanum tuberosum TaxID=4113 RepID=M1AEL3_SOLTU
MTSSVAGSSTNMYVFSKNGDVDAFLTYSNKFLSHSSSNSPIQKTTFNLDEKGLLR